MSRDFLVNSLIALCAATVMLLSIKVAATAESVTADTPIQFSRQVFGATLVSTERDGRP